jgi:hypothetical protein
MYSSTSFVNSATRNTYLVVVLPWSCFISSGEHKIGSIILNLLQVMESIKFLQYLHTYTYIDCYHIYNKLLLTIEIVILNLLTNIKSAWSVWRPNHPWRLPWFHSWLATFGKVVCPCHTHGTNQRRKLAWTEFHLGNDNQLLNKL